MSWWVPIAFLGAALLGLAIAWSLTAGRPRTPEAMPAPLPHGRRKSRYEQDNEIPWNPAAFVATVALVGALTLIAILIEVL